MNWSDIKRSLDSEFARLEAERVKQIEQDERFAEIVTEDQEKSTYEQMLEEDSEGMEQAEKELDEELKWIEKRRELDRKLVTVVKGSSVTEFKQNWKQKVEAN